MGVWNRLIYIISNGEKWFRFWTNCFSNSLPERITFENRGSTVPGTPRLLPTQNQFLSWFLGLRLLDPITSLKYTQIVWSTGSSLQILITFFFTQGPDFLISYAGRYKFFLVHSFTKGTVLQTPNSYVRVLVPIT